MPQPVSRPHIGYYAGGATTAYTYDAAGNRVGSKTGAAPEMTCTFDDASQLTTVGSAPVKHDAAGNVTSAEGTNYAWDWLDRLGEVDGPAVPDDGDELPQGRLA